MALSATMLAAARPAAGSAWCCSFAASRLLVLKRTSASISHSKLQQEPNHQDSRSLAGTSSNDSSSGSSSSSSSMPASSGNSEAGYDLVYDGFFAKPHKRLKYASLLNTFASFAAAPLIISYSSASPIARVAVTTSVLAFAVITTGGLHWFTQPYVHQLWYNKQTDTIRAQKLKFFGGTRWFEFSASSVSEPSGYQPLASFQADGRVFYVDRANFKDAALMQRLMPCAVQQQQQQQQQEEQEEQHTDSTTDASHIRPGARGENSR